MTFIKKERQIFFRWRLCTVLLDVSVRRALWVQRRRDREIAPGPLLVPLAFAMQRRRGLWVAAAVLAAVLGPFFVGDPAGFWRGVVEFQFLQPFRPDSLSLTALAVRLVGPAVLPVAVAGLILGAGVIAFCMRRSPGLPLACAAAAAAWAAVLIWNKKSFCNYWWLCSGLLSTAAAAPATRESA